MVGSVVNIIAAVRFQEIASFQICYACIWGFFVGMYNSIPKHEHCQITYRIPSINSLQSTSTNDNFRQVLGSGQTDQRVRFVNAGNGHCGTGRITDGGNFNRNRWHLHVRLCAVRWLSVHEWTCVSGAEPCAQARGETEKIGAETMSIL